jgi:hypothetical protein
VRFKLHITKPSSDISGITISSINPSSERSIFEAYASQKGLCPSDFGKKFKIRNSTYTITGIKPNAPKYCVKVVTNRGAKYVMPVADVKNNLK